MNDQLWLLLCIFAACWFLADKLKAWGAKIKARADGKHFESMADPDYADWYRNKKAQEEFQEEEMLKMFNRAKWEELQKEKPDWEQERREQFYAGLPDTMPDVQKYHLWLRANASNTPWLERKAIRESLKPPARP
jgi:hypothetical protein